MKYYLETTTKNNQKVIIRNCIKDDALEFLDVFNKTHEETDFNITYVEESSLTEQDEIAFIERKENSETDVVLVAIVDGKIAGTAGIDMISPRYKLRHRAEFGISILKEYWGLGLGNSLTKACIDLAKKAGYSVLELDVVSDNFKAVNLYKKFGFVEYGRNKKGFKSKYSGYQELILMSLDLNDNQ